MPLSVKELAIPTSAFAAELLGIELLEEHARRLAAGLTVDMRRARRPRKHLRRLVEHSKALRTVYTVLAKDVRAGEPPSPAAEWFLDNFYIVTAAARDVWRDLPADFVRRLPRVASEEYAGQPRVYALASELIRLSALRLDAQRLQRFITAFQSIAPLTMGELWAWPSALKLALVEHVRVHAEVLAARRTHRELADRIAARFDLASVSTHSWPPEAHPAFVIRLLQRSQELENPSALRHEVELALAAKGHSIEDAITAEGRHQASEQAAMASLIGSLRLISSFDWSEFFENVSLVEQVLQRDPAGVYARMDFRSRDRYRHAIEELADPTGESQQRVALASVEYARRIAERAPQARGAHVGYHLIGRGRPGFEASIAWIPTWGKRLRRLFFRSAAPIYVGAIVLGTALLLAAALIYANEHGGRGVWLLVIALLGAIPASEFTLQILQRLLSYLIPPRRLPRFDYDAIPRDARTMVIVPTILDSVERVRELAEHLEVQAAGNLDPHIHFALLSDFRDATAETLPQDEEILAAARDAITTLNARYPGEAGPFFLFHRTRQWNERERIWMGWERKRGKIEEFNRMLRGATDTSFTVQIGDLDVLPLVKYCITLDSDTRLPRDAARQLIGIITHPLNRATYDPNVGRVTEGYGILQPRVSVTYTSAAGSLFARLYAGHTGVDPYTTAVSDTYQDLFAEGSFTGKGLYDVDAFMAALEGTVPENTLLSHDLFEGLYARAGLVSDVELVDEYPSSVLTHARRQHRWIRGDWQILLWLLPVVPSRRGLTRNTLPLISRWKIFDNLRRSLVPSTLLAQLVAGWTVLPGSPLIWTAAVAAVLASELLPIAARLLASPRLGETPSVFFRNLRDDAATAMAQMVLGVTLLAYHAVDSVHAIALTIVRLAVTRRSLLEWETAAAVAARAVAHPGRKALRRFSREMIASPIVATAAAILVLVSDPAALAVASPFLLLWFTAPGIAYWLSLPIDARARPLDDRQRLLMRRTARKTWRYFDTFVTEADAWLPPDNYQEAGDAGRLARRTSPTNIAMGLLSAMAAHDLGYLSAGGLADRVDRTLTTLEGLERHEGHFLNWYDTATRAPLHPRYVSTVDSGNLAGALIALAQGCRTLIDAPQTYVQRLEGLADAAELCASVSASTTGAGAVRRAVTRVNEVARAVLVDARRAVRDGQPAQFETRGRELEEALQALNDERSSDSPDDIDYWGQATLVAIRELAIEPNVPETLWWSLARRAFVLADAMQFEFLYDRRRRIFAIGYRLADAEGPGRLDASFYDLLASEARLASFIAIAKGDVPQHHWFHLGRLVTNVHGRATLMSWGGTMFEYLLPQLLLRSFPGTLLDQSCRASVRRQIEYGRSRGVPWGISECAYTFTDRAGNYQYRAFGVPGLGLERGLAEDLVVAPYATALAALVDPAAAADNFQRLARVGLDGRFGFYEAIDYRPRLPDADASPADPAKPAIVRAYFAHHQGMSLAALANVLKQGVVVAKFHADPRVQATELLLQERVPREAIVSEFRPAESTAPASLPAFESRQFRSPHTVTPHAHTVSNGRYTTLVTNAGGGFSTWRDLAVTRQRHDWTNDSGAHFIYLRDPWSNRVWSATYLPVGQEPDAYDVTFQLEKVVFRRRDGDFETTLQVAVSPEDDVEIRRLSIVNRGDRPRDLEVTSYAEMVLGRPADDVAHPAFGKLFVETEFDPQTASLLFGRRRRSSEESPIWAFHVLGLEGRMRGAIEWETDRARFIGRGRSPVNPVALDGRALSGTTGAVLDPVASLRERVHLAPGAFVRMTFSTGVTSDRETALAMARKYRDGSAAARVLSMAFTHVHTTLQYLGLSDDQAILSDRLASRVFGFDRSLISPEDIEANTLGQSNLWGYGISGDLPIVLVRITEPDALPLVRQVLRAQDYWRVKGLRADVVILNEHPAEYLDETQNQLMRLVQEPRWAGWLQKPGGIFLLRTDGMPEADRRLLTAVARAVLRGDLGELGSQLHRPARWLYDEPRTITRIASPESASEPVSIPPLVMANSLGGFTPDGREYVVVLEGERETPLPWSNVIANPAFGTIVTASGSAFTWNDNSRENRLTPFANDPISDPTGEAIFIRDDDSGQAWGATPGPMVRQHDQGRWVIRHAAGLSRFQHAVAGLTHELTVFVAPDDPVKLSVLTVTNTSGVRRRLSLFGYVEWCLGPPDEDDRRFVVTEIDEKTGAILARNGYNTEFAGRLGVWLSSEGARSHTCDRSEFVGRHRSIAGPAALLRDQLAGRHGAGLDPCGALQVSIDIAPGETRRVAFVLAQGTDRGHALKLAERYRRLEEADATLDRVERMWDQLLGAVQVHTPDDSFDLIVNRWLVCQTLSCRIWARCGFYQPGGAFGFRDQLQDVLALRVTKPDLCRAHLLHAAAHQFVEGDVQHWWHPPSGRGTRTRCSDDRLWLPYVLSKYLSATGDESVLDEDVGFLEARQLEPGEDEAYLEPTVSAERASLFEHAVRAINRSLTYGRHGLPLMGSGDWNDGMNRVGHGGQGESVWLGWFLVTVLSEFAPICERRGRQDLADRYRNDVGWLTGMLELAWDGDWYRRAYFDDGTPLGSAQNEECRIDSVSQSWAVLSRAGEPRRVQRAMDAVQAHLMRRDAQMALLLTPPFDQMPLDPGYIKGYVPGVRENGGQYTHAAIWALIALARLGRGDTAMELFHMINPINHTRTVDGVERYRGEPYAIAADVYAHPMHVGRGGWTWYTGSAGWMYQAAIEALLGFQVARETFSIDPCIPTQWSGFSLVWQRGRTRYEVTVTNPHKATGGVSSATLDGKPVEPGRIPILDDGATHHVEIVLGGPGTLDAPRAAGMAGQSAG